MGTERVLLLSFLIGCVCGLRSMTAPALVCWGAHFGWLDLRGSWVQFFAYRASLVIFSLFAIGELIADKLPFIPSRILPGPLTVRIIFGGIAGTALAVAADVSAPAGAVAGAVGAAAAAYAGYYLRLALTGKGRLPDLLVALAEDIVAVGGGLLVVSRF